MSDEEMLFGNLQAFVIDEIHAFAGDDRGWHLLSVLDRVSKLAGRSVQHIEGRITHDNFAVKIESGCTMAELEPILTRLRTTEPSDLLPPIDADAITSLKFNNCLPRNLAQQMLQQRAHLRDPT